MHVIVDDGYFVRLTKTPTRKRQVQFYEDLGAEVKVEVVNCFGVHPKARQGVLVRVDAPKKMRRRKARKDA